MHPFLIKIHCLPSLQYKNAGCLGINEVPPGKKHAHHPPDQRSGVEGSWGLDTTGLGTQENREKHRTQNTELGTQNTGMFLPHHPVSCNLELKGDRRPGEEGGNG